MRRLRISTSKLKPGADIVQIFDTWSGCWRRHRSGVGVLNQLRKSLHVSKPGIHGTDHRISTWCRLDDGRLRFCTGVDGVSLDTTVEAGWGGSDLGDNPVLQGNLDPSILVAGGVALEQETARLLSEFAPFSHIFNLGHGIVPETPPDNVRSPWVK